MDLELAIATLLFVAGALVADYRAWKTEIKAKAPGLITAVGAAVTAFAVLYVDKLFS